MERKPIQIAAAITIPATPRRANAPWQLPRSDSPHFAQERTRRRGHGRLLRDLDLGFEFTDGGTAGAIATQTSPYDVDISQQEAPPARRRFPLLDRSIPAGTGSAPRRLPPETQMSPAAERLPSLASGGSYTETGAACRSGPAGRMLSLASFN